MDTLNINWELRDGKKPPPAMRQVLYDELDVRGNRGSRSQGINNDHFERKNISHV